MLVMGRREYVAYFGAKSYRSLRSHLAAGSTRSKTHRGMSGENHLRRRQHLGAQLGAAAPSVAQNARSYGGGAYKGARAGVW